MKDNSEQKSKEKKVYITSSGFMDWLKCPYRWSFEKRESNVIGKKTFKKQAKSLKKTHKWLKK